MKGRFSEGKKPWNVNRPRVSLREMVLILTVGENLGHGPVGGTRGHSPVRRFLPPANRTCPPNCATPTYSEPRKPETGNRKPCSIHPNKEFRGVGRRVRRGR